MAFSLIPTHVCHSIFDVDYSVLAARGIRLILADLDNTLIPYSEAHPTPELKAWLAGLKSLGLSLFVLSNSRKSRRCPEFCAELGVPYLRRAGKPRAEGYCKAMEQMGVTASQTIMLGDQLFTDGLGANNAGVEVYLVHPIEFGNLLRVIRYGLELPFRGIAKCAEKENRRL